MRVSRIDRIKRRLLRGAVQENVETIRGGAPRQLVRGRVHRWARRSVALIVPVALVSSTWFISNLASSPTPGVARLDSKPAHRASLWEPRVRSSPRATPASFPAPTPMNRAAIPLEIRRVVLDAGHGGADPGTVASRDLKEKDLTLDVQRRLRTLLERASFEVLTTRDGDHSLALRERVGIANRSGGDIFVSIHVNSIRSHEFRGIETYYLGPTDDPTLTRLAAAENRASGYSMADLRKLLDGIYADARQDESHQLASAIQTTLHQRLVRVNPSIQNWGVKKAPFVVLIATEMPAILTEVSCLSNEGEAEMLKDPAYRQQIAEALFAGIKSYAEAHRSAS